MSNAYATIHGAITEALWCYEDGPLTIGSELEDQIGRITADACDELTPTPTIIRTVEELEALDPEMVLGVWNQALDMGCIFLTAGELMREPTDPRIRWAVIASADQVRAAREALEEA